MGLGLPTASALDNIGGDFGLLNSQGFQLLRPLLLCVHECPGELILAPQVL